MLSPPFKSGAELPCSPIWHGALAKPRRAAGCSELASPSKILARLESEGGAPLNAELILVLAYEGG